MHAVGHLCSQALQESNMDSDLVQFIRDSTLLDEKENLASDQKLFYGLKKNFDCEKRNFTDAAIRLGEEVI